MAAVLLALAVPFPLPARASSVWPQKATAPFYCLDGGKGWKQVDRYVADVLKKTASTTGTVTAPAA